MKTIKIIGLTLFSFACLGQVNAQKATGSTQTVVTETAVTNKEYIQDVKTLQTYFISSEIPDTFPKYDNSLDENGNKKLVFTWLDVPENYALLSDVGIKKVEELKAKKTRQASLKK